ncbi:MAG: DNA polymerase III subunit delta' [Pseudomonadota bacterium]
MAKARTFETEAQIYPHPRGQAELFGHAAAEQVFLDACRSGRLHHAWLIGGPHGIGKATFAYRAARFILSHPDLTSAQDVSDLSVSDRSAVFHQVAVGAHPDCHAVEHDDEKSKKIISIAQVRALIEQMQSTSGTGGWRVAIIDSADALNMSAANALLKMLEEPPPRCLFFLIAHQPGRVMTTLRSRCQKLNLTPLDTKDLMRAVLHVMPEAGTGDIEAVETFSHGSVRTALNLLSGHGLHERTTLAALLERLPFSDVKAVQQFSETLARKNEDSFMESVTQVSEWCHATAIAASQHQLAGYLAGYAEQFQRQAKSVTIYNLDRKSFFLTKFLELSRLMSAHAVAA